MRGLLLLGLLAAGPALAEQTPVGRWMTQDAGGVVGIQPCGAALCGTVDGIVRFLPDGATPLDNEGRSRCHLQIIADLELEEPGLWAGHITNPDDGNVYTIHISFDPQGRLRMRGFIGIPLLGKTTTWTRYPGRVTPDCHLERG